jgi:hypothetical protein
MRSGPAVDQLSRSGLDAGESSIQSGMVPARRLVLVAVLSVPSSRYWLMDLRPLASITG